jgi:branched-chain amino acid transport system ATP-binding protein
VSQAPVLEVRDVSRSFGGVHALSGVTLALAEGELRCIIGPNGAGKSTLFKILMGTERPDRGTVAFRGRDITRTDPHRRALLGIGIKFQNLAVYDELTIRHNLRLPLQHGHRDDRSIARQSETLLGRLGLSGTEDLLARELSHGQKQWLAIGMALAMKPSLLLLDEPTAGMGPEETRETGELVKALNADGATVLVIEHDMAFVRQLDARLTVLHLGRVLAEGSVAEIESHADVRRIYLGTTDIEELRRQRAAG